ncbi:MAG: RluA family pseudouridine synthase [Spirochaetaceae bacterium]|jgi:23S rRNA pseudouridine955/2504/2580 synthase|nr:RluA family pseudouridine synthase [Spirochaetaceae bacterium]
MPFTIHETGENDIDRRLDRVIRKFLPGIPLSALYRYLRRGLIRINGEKTAQSYRIRPGDRVYIDTGIAEPAVASGPAERTPGKAQIQNLPEPEVIFANEHIIAVNKPAGIPVHGGGTSYRFGTSCRGGTSCRCGTSYRGGFSVTDMVLARFPPPDGSLSFTPGPLHRLDRGTSGILVFSASLSGARWFSAALAEHLLAKYYLGIAEGCLRGTELWEDNTYKTEKNGPGFVTAAIGGGKTAVTEASPLLHGATAEGTPITLVRYRILTGRTHQIRLQSAARGFPLLGDRAYHSGYKNGSTAGAGERFFLHAGRLEIPPDNPAGLPEVLEAPLPPLFLSFLKNNFPKDTLDRIGE